MSGAAAILARAGPLRILVSAADEARREALTAMIAAAGHAPAAAASDADLVLSELRGPGGRRSLAINAGGDEDDPAGMLPLDADPQQIDAALRAVAAGLIVRTPGGAEFGFHAIDEGDGQKLLTPREIEVLNAIGEGLTNKAIARRLGISLHTVKFHVKSIFRKLGVRSRTGAIMRASRWHRAQTVEL